MNKIFLKTPITYYGGKQKMLKIILPMIPKHRVYDEPFLGGGAVFWAKEPVRVEFINDRNGEVINFYRVLKTDFPSLKHEIDLTLHSEFQQKQAKDIYQHPEGHSEVKRAWALWTLSRQSFYAILTSCWKCSNERSFADQNRSFVNAFTEVYSQRLEHVSIYCRDALKVIRHTERFWHSLQLPHPKHFIFVYTIIFPLFLYMIVYFVIR